MKEPSYDIGNVIRNQRRLRDMSLSEASEKTGVSKAMLAQIERNESCPTISTVWKISSGLQIPIATLLSQHKSTDYKVNKLEDVAQVRNEENYIRVYTSSPSIPLPRLTTYISSLILTQTILLPDTKMRWKNTSL